MLRQMAWNARHIDASGLIEVDEQQADNWNLELFSGELTYVNAMYHLALLSAAELADAIEPGSKDGRVFRRRARRIRDAVNRSLWDPSRGLYDLSTTEREPVVQLSPCRRGHVRFVDRTGNPVARPRAMLDLVLRPGTPEEDPKRDRPVRLLAPGLGLYGKYAFHHQGNATGIILRGLIPGAPYALRAQSERSADLAAAKGWRWVAEMEEIAASMAAAGLPPGFHQAAAEIFDRAAQADEPGAGVAPGTGLDTVMSALI